LGLGSCTFEIPLGIEATQYDLFEVTHNALFV